MPKIIESTSSWDIDDLCKKVARNIIGVLGLDDVKDTRVSEKRIAWEIKNRFIPRLPNMEFKNT